MMTVDRMRLLTFQTWSRCIYKQAACQKYCGLARLNLELALNSHLSDKHIGSSFVENFQTNFFPLITKQFILLFCSITWGR